MNGGIFIKGLINKSGVYAWKVNGTIRYVGSGGDLESRNSNHKSRLRKGTHIPALQKLFNAYGEEAFEFIVLEYCKKSSLFEREDYYKKIYADTVFNKNGIRNYDKSIRRGKAAANYKEKFREIMSGENNPHCTKLNKEKIFDILDMVKDGINKEKIAGKYDISPAYIYRIGKDRWVKEYREWQNKRVDVLQYIQPTCATAIAQ